MASYSVNPEGVAWAQRLIDSGQYVLDSDWGNVQPRAREQNAFVKSHSWDEYAQWHLVLTDGAAGQTKARYAFAYGDFRRLHRHPIADEHHVADDVAPGDRLIGRYAGQNDRGDAERLLQLADLGAHADSQARVEVAERLVEQQDVGLGGERTRNRDALLLAAAELLRQALSEMRVHTMVVTSGVTIGEHCVVGANSVVTQDVEPFTLVAGAPARVVRRIKPGFAERLTVSGLAR